jgi:hypothetical protein
MDRQDLNPVNLLLLNYYVFNRIIKNHFAEFDFDLHFPNARHTHENFIGGILKFMGDGRREFFNIAKAPYKSMRV